MMHTDQQYDMSISSVYIAVGLLRSTSIFRLMLLLWQDVQDHQHMICWLQYSCDFMQMHYSMPCSRQDDAIYVVLCTLWVHTCQWLSKLQASIMQEQPPFGVQCYFVAPCVTKQNFWSAIIYTEQVQLVTQVVRQWHWLTFTSQLPSF